jgi:hypothetical protein
MYTCRATYPRFNNINWRLSVKVGDLVKWDKSITHSTADHDLVKWENVIFDSMEHYLGEHGLVVKMSRTGHDTESAQVLFNDGETWWLDSDKLVVVSESR